MTRSTADNRTTFVSPTPPSSPRLRMQPIDPRRTLLDGGWWPRSTDPVAELPGLILAIDQRHGPITRLVLATAGWDSHPLRLRVSERVVRLGYFTSQPVSLLTALCANGNRVDLLVIPPQTAGDTADTAMTLAAATDNHLRPEHILTAAGTPIPSSVAEDAKQAWESEGGRLRAVPSAPGPRPSSQTRPGNRANTRRPMSGTSSPQADRRDEEGN